MLGDVQSPGEPAPGGRALPDAVLDNVPTLIARVDREERYTYVNRAYAEWVGRTAGDIVGRTVADIHAPDIYANMSAHLRQGR
jgi:PAS domain S-box-containing protein